jgi:hypothetical protein
MPLLRLAATILRYTQLLAAAQQIPKTMPTLQRMLNTTLQLQLNNTPALRTTCPNTPAATRSCCYSNTQHRPAGTRETPAFSLVRD